MLAFVENTAILDELAVIERSNVVAVRSRNLGVLALDLLRAIRRLRRVGVDAVVDLESFSRISAIISYLTGAQTRVGLHSFFGEGSYRGDLMTHRVIYNPRLPARATLRPSRSRRSARPLPGYRRSIDPDCATTSQPLPWSPPRRPS